MLVRKLTELDVPQHNEVSSSAFIWKVDENEDRRLPENAQVYGAFLEDGVTLAADLECISFRNYYCGKVLGCVGIGGVASKPEYRRGGAVRSLFNRVFEIAPSQGWDISILYPFSTQYYRKFGYELVQTNMRLDVPFTAFSQFDRGTADICRKGDLDRIRKLYNGIASKTEMMFVRDTDTYFHLDPYGECIYTYIWKNSSGEDRGYVCYEVNRAERLIVVKEIMYYDRQALAGMLGFLRAYDGNQTGVQFIRLTQNSTLPLIFNEPRNLTRTLRCGGSARILNLEAVLKAYKYPEESGRFSFKSLDTLERNAGVFTVEYKNGTCEVTKSDVGEYGFTLEAHAAARLFLGLEGLGADALEFVDGFERTGELDGYLNAFKRHDVDFADGF